MDIRYVIVEQMQSGGMRVHTTLYDTLDQARKAANRLNKTAEKNLYYSEAPFR